MKLSWSCAFCLTRTSLEKSNDIANEAFRVLSVVLISQELSFTNFDFRIQKSFQFGLSGVLPETLLSARLPQFL